MQTQASITSITFSGLSLTRGNPPVRRRIGNPSRLHVVPFYVVHLSGVCQSAQELVRQDLLQDVAPHLREVVDIGLDQNAMDTVYISDSFFVKRNLKISFLILHEFVTA